MRKKRKPAVKAVTSTVQDLAPSKRVAHALGRGILPFGSDNLWPQAVSQLHRNSIPLRAVTNSRIEYILGGGYMGQGPFFDWFEANNFEDTLERVLGDYERGGNAWLELITSPGRAELKAVHHDWTTVRKDEKEENALVSFQWAGRTSFLASDKNDKAVREVPLYPAWSEPEGGIIRTMYHWKRYESEFRHYGVPAYLPALNAGAIGYKTTKWNLSRLDNSMRSSGILIVKNGFKSDEEATEFADAVTEEHTGEGQNHKFMVLTVNPEGGTEYVELGRTDEGDWAGLHRQSTGDIVTACQWFRSLCALEDSTGFNTERILNEYQLALRTVVGPMQKKIRKMLSRSIGEAMGWEISADTFEFVNASPIDQPDPFKTINEIREENGLEPISEGGETLWANVSTNNSKGGTQAK